MSIINESSTDITVTYDYNGQGLRTFTETFGSPKEFYEWQARNKRVYIWHVAGLYK